MEKLMKFGRAVPEISAPFFCANLTYGLCGSCEVPESLFAVFTWLGYLTD